MPDTYPFLRLTNLPQRREPDGLVGFSLPHAFTPRSLSSLGEKADIRAALQSQVQLVKHLWDSGVTAFDLRYVGTDEQKDTLFVGLLCRLKRPANVPQQQFRDYCMRSSQRIQRIFADFGYNLIPLVDESALIRFISPFRFQAIAEVRRKEEVLVAANTLNEYEFYVTYPWQWTMQSANRLYSALQQRDSNCLLSIYLEPTQLSSQEQAHLNHAASLRMRDLLLNCGSEGMIVHKIYQQFATLLRQPYLMRIGIAASQAQTIDSVGRAVIDMLSSQQSPGTTPTLHIPRDQREWQHANHNLFHLEWVPWGKNKGMDMPGTTRLRYLMDNESASMAFRLPTLFAAPKIAPANIPTSTIAKHACKVLLIFANPRQEYNLRLGSEDRIIHEAIRLGKYRDAIALTPCHAATRNDLRRALLNDTFQVVHISGHGTDDGLILEDEYGKSNPVPADVLARIIAAYSPPIQCVVLNACYSAAQGELIARAVPFTIAMAGLLNDAAAKEFSRGFYDAIGAGKPYDFAYGEGCRAADMVIAGASSLIQLFRGSH
ncbi:MAG TPA: CHAT domain-containing protein [Ktedonobacteraceae bacterium]|nr:CHAT domain-containing protein [Ktedonobacteraceae bacterium]